MNWRQIIFNHIFTSVTELINVLSLMLDNAAFGIVHGARLLLEQSTFGIRLLLERTSEICRTHILEHTQEKAFYGMNCGGLDGVWNEIMGKVENQNAFLIVFQSSIKTKLLFDLLK